MTTPTEASAALPTSILLTVDEFFVHLPPGAWIGTPADRLREIALPTQEVLATNLPRIRFSLLCELLPDCLRRGSADPEWIFLPADRVALACMRRSLPEAPPAVPRVPSWKRLGKPILAPPPKPVVKPQPEPANSPTTIPGELERLASLPGVHGCTLRIGVETIQAGNTSVTLLKRGPLTLLVFGDAAGLAPSVQETIEKSLESLEQMASAR